MINHVCLCVFKWVIEKLFTFLGPCWISVLLLGILFIKVLFSAILSIKIINTDFYDFLLSLVTQLV